LDKDNELKKKSFEIDGLSKIQKELRARLRNNEADDKL